MAMTSPRCDSYKGWPKRAVCWKQDHLQCFMLLKASPQTLDQCAPNPLLNFSIAQQCTPCLQSYFDKRHIELRTVQQILCRTYTV
eukprot:283686-Pelagomonas_calceolata.AAC.1